MVKLEWYHRISRASLQYEQDITIRDKYFGDYILP